VRIYQVGERVLFYGRPSTVVYASPPHRYWPRWTYDVVIDGDGLHGPTELARTAIGVRGEELEPLEERREADAQRKTDL
jgi:hypothetical protein